MEASSGPPTLMFDPPSGFTERKEAGHHISLMAAGPITEAPAPGRSDNPFEQLFAAPDARSATRSAGTVNWESAEGDEPLFLRSGDRARGRAGRAALAVGCVLLVSALVVELALLLRASVVAQFPEVRPALVALCAPLSCTVPWPMHPELLAVVSSELETLPGTGALEFDAVVRNRAGFPVALPAMELTLTDARNHPVARKVFRPADYTTERAGDNAAVRADAAAIEAMSIGPGADLSIRLLFELPGADAAGFVAYPFYP